MYIDMSHQTILFLSEQRKGGKVKSFYVWDGRENDLVINTLKDLDLIPWKKLLYQEKMLTN